MKYQNQNFTRYFNVDVQSPELTNMLISLKKGNHVVNSSTSCDQIQNNTGKPVAIIVQEKPGSRTITISFAGNKFRGAAGSGDFEKWAQNLIRRGEMTKAQKEEMVEVESV